MLDFGLVKWVQIVEITVASTKINHVEECTFRSRDQDVVVLLNTLCPDPQFRIDDTKLIGLFVNLHDSVQITYARHGIIILEHNATSLKHIFQ